jgi:hypothetical protein
VVFPQSLQANAGILCLKLGHDSLKNISYHMQATSFVTAPYILRLVRRRPLLRFEMKFLASLANETAPIRHTRAARSNIRMTNKQRIHCEFQISHPLDVRSVTDTDCVINTATGMLNAVSIAPLQFYGYPNPSALPLVMLIFMHKSSQEHFAKRCHVLWSASRLRHIDSRGN